MLLPIDVTLRRTGPKLDQNELDIFEREIGGLLPADYKQFLLAANGGFVVPEVAIRWNGKIQEVPAFGRLLPTSESGLRRAFRNYCELGIDGFLPIASTMNMDDICLAITTKPGTVWFAVSRYENDVHTGASFFPLADTFFDFLKLLIVVPKVFCPIMALGESGTPEDLVAYLSEGNSIDAIGVNDCTILCEAIKFDNMPMIHACVRQGASLRNTMRFAVINQRPDLFKIFIDAGADVNERDSNGDRPLAYVGGTALPGEEGALNRRIYDALIALGATK